MHACSRFGAAATIKTTGGLHGVEAICGAATALG